MAQTPPSDILLHFRATHARFVAKTGHASVWQVEVPRGCAALKVYHAGHMGNEAQGLAFARAFQGRGMSEIWDATSDAVLSQWLPGPSLGDIARSGQDMVAATVLGGLAQSLHQQTDLDAAGFASLSDWFAALFALRFSPSLPRVAQNNLERAQTLAYRLLSHQQDVRVLHGDLHHDNIRLDGRRYVGFDAKGVIGDRAFEFANAFRHPRGADATVRDPARISRFARLWCELSGIPEKRLLDWAIAKCALSIAWRNRGPVRDDPECDLLAILISTRGGDRPG